METNKEIMSMNKVKKYISNISDLFAEWDEASKRFIVKDKHGSIWGELVEVLVVNSNDWVAIKEPIKINVTITDNLTSSNDLNAVLVNARLKYKPLELENILEGILNEKIYTRMDMLNFAEYSIAQKGSYTFDQDFENWENCNLKKQGKIKI